MSTVQDRVDERHVEFSSDVADDAAAEQRESTRLQRRDTPHHLKNKRVNTATPPPGTTTPQGDETGQAGAADAEDRVRRILARQIGKICESFESASSEQNDASEVSCSLTTSSQSVNTISQSVSQ